MTLLAQAQELKWRQVPEAAIKLAEEARADVEQLQLVTQDLPRDGFRDLWYNPTTKQAFITFGPDEEDLQYAQQWRDSVSAVAEPVLGTPAIKEGGWVKAATRTFPAIRFQEKRAADPKLKGLLQYTGYLPGKIPGAPHPLIAMLSSGLLGAGLGYGGGKMLNWLMPETERWNITPRLALMGGLAGAAPAGAWMLANRSAGLPTLSGELMQGDSYISDTPEYNRPVTFSDFGKQSSLGWDVEDHPDYSFDSHDFNRTIWEDPRVANRLDAATQAAATGLVTGAAHMRGSPRLVSPGDIGRVTAGMGSGYVAGAIVGKALGALLGMPQTTQNKLKQTGMWAGVVANLVPMAFGAR